MRPRALACVAAFAAACSGSDDSASVGPVDAVDTTDADAALVADSDRDADVDISFDAPDIHADTAVDAVAKTDAAARTRVYGVTTDSIDALPDVVAALSVLPHRPTTRIVFDEVPAATYADAAKQIHAVSDVMGELMDSFYMKDFTLDQANARTDEYLLTLGGEVDVWEIGNEINGDWLGDTASVVAKMTATFDRVRAKSGKTALTLYWFEPTCLPDAEHEMFAWVDAHVPASMRGGLDWVLISYYEEDCGGARPDSRGCAPPATPGAGRSRSAS